MNIVVCIKQVPDVNDIKWTKENNLDRTQMLSKINTQDEWALDFALMISSEIEDANITVISMGPNSAKDILDYSLAKGANRAILLSDKLFAGSDTLITAQILSKAILKYVPDFDLIITGQMAQDGDTQQVPVSLAQKLDIVDIEQVIKIEECRKNTLCVTQKLNNTINSIEVKTPCLIAINKEPKTTYIPKIDDYIRAQDSFLEIYNAQDLEITQSGVLSSPTVVFKAFRPNFERNAQELKSDISKELINLVLRAKSHE